MKFKAILLIAFLQVSAFAQPYTIDDYIGTWTGQWVNTTFGSTGPASNIISSNSANMTAEMILDLDGFVFGGNDPDAMNLAGNYTASEFTVSAQTDLFGDFTLTVNDQGIISGQGVNVTNPSIDNFDFSGTSTPMQMNMDYTINFDQSVGGGQAFGVLTLTKNTVGIEDAEGYTSDGYSLKQNFPNPFNPNTNINFSLPSDNHVSLSIYNMTGQLIRNLVNQSMNSGEYSVSWDGKDNLGNPLSGGVYIYNLQIEGVNMTKKMILMK